MTLTGPQPTRRATNAKRRLARGDMGAAREADAAEREFLGGDAAGRRGRLMAETATPKRKPGRPKGLPRTGGRAKGTPNRKNQVTRDYVIREGAPLQFLCSVVRGKRFTAAAEPGDRKRTHVFPSMDQRLRAAEILSRKVLPDLKATEVTGKDGGPVALTLLDFLKGLPD